MEDSIFSLHRIYDKHKFFAQRLDKIQQTLDSHVTDEQRKFIVPPSQINWEGMGYPYEMPQQYFHLQNKRYTVIEEVA